MRITARHRVLFSVLAAALLAAAGWSARALWWANKEARPNPTTAVVAAVPVVRIPPADEPLRLEATTRYLRASEYVSLTRASLRTLLDSTVQQSAAKMPVDLRQLLDAEPALLESAVAPVLASRLTLEQAKQLADFYESAAGRFVVAESKAPGSHSDGSQASRFEASIKAFFESEAAGVLLAVLNEPVLVEAMVLAARTGSKAAPLDAAPGG